MQKRIKVSFEEKEVEIEAPETLEKLKNNLIQSFPSGFPEEYKIRYIDADADKITVDSQEDYANALDTPDLKLIIVSLTEKRVFLKTAMVMTEVKSEYVTEEELKKKESNHSPIALQTDSSSDSPIRKPTTDKDKDKGKEETKKEEEIKIPTDEAKSTYIKTNEEEKTKMQPVEAKSTYFETKEDKKAEVQTNTTNINSSSAVQTEPEKIPEKVVDCVSCNGTKKNKKGETCKKCSGTGKINEALKKYMDKKVKDEASRIAQQESLKMSELLSQKDKRLDGLIKNLEQSMVFKVDSSCSLCKGKIEPGGSVYYCQLCEGIMICEDCEDNNGHQHALLKGRVEGEKKILKMKVLGAEPINKTMKPQHKFVYIWSVQNTGKTKWLEKVKPIACDGYNLKPVYYEIKAAEPKEKTYVSIELTAPPKAGKYNEVFMLFSEGKSFGDPLRVDIEVKEEEAEVKQPEVKKEEKKVPVEEVKRELIEEDKGENVYVMPSMAKRSTSDLIRDEFDQLERDGLIKSHMKENFISLMKIYSQCPAENIAAELVFHENNLDAAADSLSHMDAQSFYQVKH